MLAMHRLTNKNGEKNKVSNVSLTKNNYFCLLLLALQHKRRKKRATSTTTTTANCKNREIRNLQQKIVEQGTRVGGLFGGGEESKKEMAGWSRRRRAREGEGE